MIDSIRKTVAESLELKKSFFPANATLIAEISHQICLALENGNKVLLYGNGGSAADAQHIAGELVGRFVKERRPLAAVALTTDTSVLTSVGNDYGYDQVFVRHVRALGRQGDVAIGISVSGNSPNVLAATEAAQEIGMVTVGLTGNDGGRLGSKVRYHVNVPHKTMARVQEIHMMVGHIVCQLVDENLKGL